MAQRGFLFIAEPKRKRDAAHDTAEAVIESLLAHGVMGRKVVLTTGDGFMFQAIQLTTAMRHTLPLVAGVYDDGAFGGFGRSNTTIC